MVAERETTVYRRTNKGTELSAQERERLAKPFLPPVSSEDADEDDDEPSPGLINRSLRRLKPIHDFLLSQLHHLIYTILHTVFSIYIRIRQGYNVTVDRVLAILYYHHRTPELIKRDVQNLNRLPEHLSVILSFADEDAFRDGRKPGIDHDRPGSRDGVASPAELEALIDDVAEISAWCACAGIPRLSVYESTGTLKRYMSAVSLAVSAKLRAYFGTQHPSLQVGAPHMGSLVNGEPLEKTLSPLPSDGRTPPASAFFSLLLISAEDGRDSVVDLTKTLTEMSQRGKISPSDINLPLVDAELTENVMDEPDLLILFDGNVQLRSFPPWQLRLTEIFHVQDSQGVGYQVFLRGLYSFAKAQMRFGR
ncbi:MAG: hypothetical protein M4579_001468 [Chaenotheca gracillima]|nr:MAG: hypothetical protein M4579_001468 [Chaenotheca gracillima]